MKTFMLLFALLVDIDISVVVDGWWWVVAAAAGGGSGRSREGDRAKTSLKISIIIHGGCIYLGS